MTANNEKQLFQVQNIIDTLLEATDHFANLLKEKEFNQSITIFSSIVEGSEAVMAILNEIDKRFIPHSQILEKYLVMIVGELEKGTLLKIAEIVQFSLRPHFIHLQQMFIEQLGNQEKDGPISIGMFHSLVNPKDAIEQGRLDATLKEAHKQGAHLYFFTSDDVNFNNKTIDADTLQNNAWKRVTVPFPDVINNIGAGRRSHVDRKLRREVPFTNFYVGNKYTLPKEMLKHRKFIDLLIPFQVCSNEDIIYNFLHKNNQVVFKALGSNRGEDIYFVTKRGTRYLVLDQKKEKIMNEEVFQDFIESIILEENDSYIIQKYVHTRTKDDEPYHFRSHVQKDGEGSWQITHIYPRIGSKKSNLSNISTEGRIEVFADFLLREYGKKQGAIYEKEILHLSIDVAQHLDKIYGLAISELGLDFAIDDAGRIWMHEANNGPQTAYHEDKRAVNFIAYAKYIAQKGLMYTDNNTKNALVQGQFHAKSSNLPIEKRTDKKTIGVLTRNQPIDEFNERLTRRAELLNMSLYAFHHKDIDFDLGLIKASFFKDEEWIEQISEYPDLIIDRLNMRGHEDPTYIYEELDEVPFTNEWPLFNSTRNNLYKTIENKQANTENLASYIPVKTLYNVLQQIEKHHKVIIVPNEFKSNRNAITVELLSNNSYRMIQDNKIKEHSELTLRHALQHEHEKEAHIVMPDMRFTLSENQKGIVRAHLMKDEHNKWSIISKYGELQTISNTEEIEVSNTTVEELLVTVFNDTETTNTLNKIEKVSINFSHELERSNSIPINELSIKLGINADHQFKVIDANPNSQNIINDEETYAKAVISYAHSLVENNKQ